MTREETQKLLMMIEATYPNFKISDATPIINSWHLTLQEFSAGDVAIALETFKRTDRSGFAPQVGQLVDCIFKAQDMTQMSAVEAWGIVSRAVRNSGYHAQEQFDYLKKEYPLIAKVVYSPSQLYNWSQTDLVVLEGSIAKQFQISYEIMAKREREYNRMPLEARTKIDAITQNTMLELPQWENPTPIVVAQDIDDRADPDEIDSHMARLREILWRES